MLRLLFYVGGFKSGTEGIWKGVDEAPLDFASSFPEPRVHRAVGRMLIMFFVIS